jgi:hypothetical protein
MRSKRSHEGWLYIDNRDAPAVTAAQAAAWAPGREVVGAGVNGVYESALITCSHCQRTVVLNPQRSRERGYCRKCDHYICDSPACNAGCVPMHLALDVGQEHVFRAEQAGNRVETDRVIRALRRNILG